MATTAPPPAGATQPTLLAKRYRLDRRLAHGGMSEVWVATDTTLDRQVAVKLLKASLADDPIVVERFRREAVAAAGLNHPYIVSIYDTVEDAGREAVVMELVPGRSLRNLLDERGRLSVEDTLVVGRAMAAALDHAHRAGLVHRDVKPGNVLVTPEGRVKLTDFGIAKALEQRHDDLTAENVMMGTAKYLSPEQVLGFPLDGRADLYSLGLVLYECVTGKVPFTGATDGATAIARLQRDPAPIRKLRPDVPAPVADAITCLLARRPEDRPATAAAARGLLTDASDGRDDATLPPFVAPKGNGSPQPPAARGDRADGSGSITRRHTRILVAGAALAAAVGVGAAVAIATAGNGATPLTTGGPNVVNSSNGQLGSVPATLGPLGAGSGPVTIADIREFDPSPGDGSENPRALGRLTDGNPATAWTTVCYESKYLYPKQGVGLVVGLTGPVNGQRLRIAWPTGPWRVAIYTAAQPGARLEEWGKPVASRGSDAPGESTFPLGSSDHRYVLVWLTQVARSDACSANPYRGAVGELTVEPAGDSVDGASSDDALAVAAAAGDREALELLLRHNVDMIHAVCTRLAGNPADGADATQEALIAIVRGLPRFDGRASVRTWMYRVATNACLDELRRRGRRPAPGLPEVVADHTDDAPGLDNAVADRLSIEAALAELPEEYRVAVVLRDVEGMDYAQIAEVLDVPVGTVRSRIARGRRRLAERLGGNRGQGAERPKDRP